MKSWALIVGINDYPASAGQNPLQGAVADACDFAAWALDPGGGAVEPDRLFFWTHPWPDDPGLDLAAMLNGELGKYLASPAPAWSPIGLGAPGPSHAVPPCAFEITSTMENLGRALAAQAREDDDVETRRVYVFLAGHGVRAMTIGGQQETCFLAGDARPASGNLATGMVPCDTFRRALLNNRFDEAVVFTDCCRTEVMRTSLIVQNVSDALGTPTKPYVMGFAAKDNELAYETEAAPKRGVFSSVLMQGLRRHRTGTPAALHAKHLNDFVQENVSVFTSRGQMPHVAFEPQPAGPLLVTGAPPAAPERPTGAELDVSALPKGTSLVLHDGADDPIPAIAPFVVDGPILQLPPLKRGLYLIVNVGSGRWVQFRHPSAETIRVE